MNKIQGIDEKINRLKNLKLQVETRLARALYRKMQAILKEEFTPQLAAAIVSENWNNTTQEQKEKWRSTACTFPTSKTSKISANR
jgi:hypothetical protein